MNPLQETQRAMPPMAPYPKIQSPFKRGEKGVFTDEWAHPAFEYLADVPWCATEKVDGMNMRLYITDRIGFAVGGRTNDSQVPAQLQLHMAELGARLYESGELAGLTLYGEGFGPKIQSGGKYRDDQAFIMFDARTNLGRWLERGELEAMAARHSIPLVVELEFRKLGYWVSELRAAAFDGSFRSALNPAAEAEGVVLRPAVELQDGHGNRIITKLKLKDFR